MYVYVLYMYVYVCIYMKMCNNYTHMCVYICR